MRHAAKKNVFIIPGILSSFFIANLWAHDEAQSTLTSEVLVAAALANVPGQQLTAVRVELAPGHVSDPHRHAGFVFIYVLEGRVESQLNNGEIMTFKTGESWVEPPGTLHSHAKNPSDTETAKILAVFVAEQDAQLTTMEKPE